MRLVDLNKVLEHLCEYCKVGCYEYCNDRCIEFINMSNLLTIEAEPVKHGRWVKIGADEFVCSECCAHYEYESCECDHKYCPTCGAKMRSDDE